MNLPPAKATCAKRRLNWMRRLRVQKGNLNASTELLKLLRDAQDDPGRLLASPGRLLESQPALKRLKEGLVDAQLATAKLQGSMSPDHPLIRGAKAAEVEISQHLHDELSIAIKGVEVDVRLAQNRIETLESQRAALAERQQRISELRASYANLISICRHRTEILKTAQDSSWPKRGPPKRPRIKRI